jgi:ParB family chromosome partitioning protein
MPTKIVAVKEVPLASLVIGKGQVRVRDVGKDIDELASSIRKLGQLEPIVVCPAKERGKFEILTGQRRYLACKQLKKETIWACVLDHEVDEIEAKVISVTENLVRRDLNRKDLIDACTVLYRKYLSIKDVAEETGLPYPKVALYVKYDRLDAPLKKMVDNNEVDLKAALRAQDAASVSGKFNAEEAVVLAKELSKMSGAQQARIVQRREEEPHTDVSEIIEAAKTGEKITQIVVTIGGGLHQALKQYAKDEDTTVDDAAGSLIEEALTGKGYSRGE